jgi:hypothetical protein
MEFNDLTELFTRTQKVNSFLYLQNFILEKIKNDEPFFIGRLSGNECNLCGKVLTKTKLDGYLLHEMLTAAGVQMLSAEDIKQYVKLYTTSCKNSNILAVWSGSMYTQTKPYYDFLDKMYPQQKRICAQALEPFYFTDHSEYRYSDVFKNKKVLIISSHKETTKQQLKYCANIFNKPIFHETTDFHIYKPSQQNGGNHDSNSWTFHFTKMKDDLFELKKTFDFDIALVSCGGFGMIVSDYIHSQLKKSVMYVGGGLQLYFGIIGNRWKTHPVVSKLMNDKWTRVVDNDKPPTLSSNPILCENSCYW